ncbi:hypothetical protein M404DRAFT_994190 [Pisolithus tinctorius Marx 270]|uniref:Uncharacterized protein n=1 Tax=Pisolithus tinctorius Marx 270 TaxID=870435 RepID=A0A0C3PSW4_PISTI|nr:hypothetical protein M404DRAFT_994190 [Pisolithus tinctorius Marx 270]
MCSLARPSVGIWGLDSIDSGRQMKVAGHRPFILHGTAQRTRHNQIKRASIPLLDHNE